jgi:hypothetical protein
MKCSITGCNANALKKDSDGHCYQHSKKVSEERHKARAKGGRHTKRHIEHIKSIETILDVKKILSDVLVELMACDGNVLPRSRAVGYLCSIILDCIEKGDFEERLDILEKKIEERITS